MKANKADLVLKNVTAYTVDPASSVVGCLAVKDGRIVAAGSEAQVLEGWDPGRVVDGHGAFAYPGFMDPHSHFTGYGLSLDYADLKGAGSWEEAVARLQARQERQPTPWVQGWGWDHTRWPGQAYPTRDLLDRVFPDRPALLVRTDGHAAVANGAALALAGVDAATRIDGGEFAQAGGRLTGLLIDNAIDRVRKAVPVPGRDDQVRALLAAQASCFAVGLTSVSDAGIACSLAQLMDELHRDGRLRIRIYAMLDPTEENYEHFLARGPYLTDRLTIRSVKLYADGALGSRGALLMEPYQDDPGNRGLQLTSDRQLEEVCRRAAAAGYQVNTHAIGDAAVRMMLELYGRHLPRGRDLRWRIEHAQIVADADLPLFGALGVVPSIQASHATTDMRWAAERLGPRVRTAYRYRELLAQNGWIPNGSDFPVESINPVLGFYAAVARKDVQGWPGEGFQPDNALTREQALRAMTLWAARANFEERGRGSLETGKWADLVLLDRDLMAAPEAELPGARVLATFVAGEQVFEKE
jgi:predicted amidohydrolase YtcJ